MHLHRIVRYLTDGLNDNDCELADGISMVHHVFFPLLDNNHTADPMAITTHHQTTLVSELLGETNDFLCRLLLHWDHLDMHEMNLLSSVCEVIIKSQTHMPQFKKYLQSKTDHNGYNVIITQLFATNNYQLLACMARQNAFAPLFYKQLKIPPPIPQQQCCMIIDGYTRRVCRSSHSRRNKPNMFQLFV
eukprot:442272_1